MRPRAKYAVIHRHRSEYSVSTMCRFFGVSRSGYYDFVRRIGKPEKDAELAAAIRQQQEKSFNTYGYRRMCLALKSKGIHCNPKTILRMMKKYDLLSEIRRRRKWVNMGQQLHRYENLLNRQFHADKPNRKWVTDISYIHAKQGILYLSMIRNLYDIKDYYDGSIDAGEILKNIESAIMIQRMVSKAKEIFENNIRSSWIISCRRCSITNTLSICLCPKKLTVKTFISFAPLGSSIFSCVYR